MHCEERKGSHEDAVKYCSKEETRISEPVIFGSHNEQGKRNDLNSVCTLIKEKGGMSGLIESMSENPTVFVKYSRGLIALANHFSEKRNHPTELYIYWGAPGTGKTRTAYEAHNNTEIYMKNDSIWWDGYTNQPIVIIDDYAPYHALRLNELLRLADRYPYQVQIKGGTIQFVAKRIYITTNFEPVVLFGLLNENNPMTRRITLIKEFK